MDAPGWLAPVTGTLAMATGLGLVGVYAFGLSVPAEHHVAVRTHVDVPPNEVQSLLVDFPRRPEWRPYVTRIGRVDDTPQGQPVWRELDRGGDRFDFTVVAVGPGEVVLATARPDDIGIRATWTWTIAPENGGTAITLTEDGAVDNPFFRGYWALADGPWEAIEEDLGAFAAMLGGAAPIVHLQNR